MREPNSIELEMLRDHLDSLGGQDTEELLDHHNGIVVLENIVPDCPGYTGRVMIVIWPAGASYFEAFYFPDGKLVPLQQDKGIFDAAGMGEEAGLMGLS